MQISLDIIHPDLLAAQKLVYEPSGLLVETLKKKQKAKIMGRLCLKSREKLYQVLMGNCCPDRFQKLFERAAARAKVKIRPGRFYSRDKAGKPKRHHVFRRVC
jgi:hypothetical protein